MTALIDTNVLVRFLTGENQGKYRSLHAFFLALETGRVKGEIKHLVFFQTIFVLKSFYGVPKIEIIDALKRLFAFKGVRIREKKLIVRTIDLWRENNLEIVDSFLVACLEGDARNTLYSYDRGFDRFPFVRIEP
jgi:predicted nucleic acid-binding protein